MGDYNEADYIFSKLYFYPIRDCSVLGLQIAATAEIEVLFGKGRLKCRASVAPGSTAVPPEELNVILFNETDGNGSSVGKLKLDNGGAGECHWQFYTVSRDEKNAVTADIVYRLIIAVRKEKVLEAVFRFSEIRDNRVIGFQQEVKVKRPNRKALAENRIFQKVEPFEPPIPNVSWWRISIQPYSADTYGPMHFCPHRKTRAVF